VPGPYVPHDPLLAGKENIPQAVFLLLDELEVFYGGAAGGGKSDALLMAGLQYVDVPGYAGIIFRRTFTDLELPGGLIERSQEWLGGTDAKWIDRMHTWSFPSGATLSFGYLEHEQDKYRYKSAEFQYVAFDELTQFSEAQYRYLFSRLRRPSKLADPRLSQIPLRMRGASNPGDRGHAWVRRYFIPRPVVDEETGERKIEIPTDGVTGRRRIFIPAKLSDNPYLDQITYRENLRRLDPLEAARLEAGDWDAMEGGKLFVPGREQYLEARPADVPRWCRYWDFAATDARDGDDPDYTVGALLGKTKDGKIVVGDVVRGRWSPARVEEVVRSVAERDGRAIMIRLEQEPGSSGKASASHFIRHVLSGFDVKAERVTGPKEVRARAFAAQWDAGNVYLVRAPWNAELVEELVAFPSSGIHDDQVDATSGAFESITGYRRRLRPA
jgi:predicted phage terminase large subunit-like protein